MYKRLPRRKIPRMLRLYVAIIIVYITRVMTAKMMLITESVRNDLIRLWSPIRCIISPMSFTSKNDMGSFISFMRKSEISDMLILLVICKLIQLRNRPLAVWLRLRISWATRTITTKDILLLPIPVSTSDWVRNGKMRLIMLAVTIPRISWRIYLL